MVHQTQKMNPCTFSSFDSEFRVLLYGTIHHYTLPHIMMTRPNMFQRSVRSLIALPLPWKILLGGQAIIMCLGAVYRARVAEQRRRELSMEGFERHLRQQSQNTDDFKRPGLARSKLMQMIPVDEDEKEE